MKGPHHHLKYVLQNVNVIVMTVIMMVIGTAIANNHPSPTAISHHTNVAVVYITMIQVLMQLALMQLSLLALCHAVASKPPENTIEDRHQKFGFLADSAPWRH